MLNQKPLFNPSGDREIEKRRIIKGNPTNLFELNNVKYQWAYDFYKIMAFDNYWIPQEIPMNNDRKQYEELSKEERDAYDKVLSFLVFLDSLQTNNLPNFADYITAPEVVMALTAQDFQEALHSFSYAYIIDSVIDPLERDRIYNLWRDDEVLFERNKVIANEYQRFLDEPNEENFIRALFANYILEAIYFYAGFAFFYCLGRQGKMLGTVQEIRYINRDELTHVQLFQHIISTVKKENPELFNEEVYELAYKLFEKAVKQEIKWGQYITKNKIIGLNNDIIDQYIKYLGNLRLKQIGLNPLWPEIKKHPMQWIEEFRKINTTKTDFFQARPATYTKPSNLKW
ncbi:MAG TPA: ribonucleotide-diphosphate reductase subunit beta [Nautiliaceae bacterium]|nr:ribonucleotide-diphosphate reductase subunit beta [Nautiliaceae bacterium]